MKWRSVRQSHVARMRRALLLLVAAACTAVALLNWRLQSEDRAHRPLHALYARKTSSAGHRPPPSTATSTGSVLPASSGYLQPSQGHRYNLWHPVSERGVEPQWSWVCRNLRCERLLASETSTLQSLPTCNMLCDSAQLWPQPTGPVSVATAVQPVRADSFTLQVLASPSRDVSDHLTEAFELMKMDMRVLERSSEPEHRTAFYGYPREVVVRVAINGSADPRMRLDTDESYELTLSPANNTLVADITAHSFCGARHGFETLSQIVWMDAYAGSLLILEAASVVDAPRFSYRGLLLDTARNFFLTGEILRTIDAMAACKMNTFHWHVSDSQSFPLRLDSAPQLAAHGAYGPDAVYSPDDVRSVVRHAKLRGVRVLLEVDAPAHVGRAWSWGPGAGLGHLVHCVELEPWAAYCGEPPCGQLNPRNPHVYELLQRIYAEIIHLTEVDDLFHLGGDDVTERCWAQHFNDTDPMELWLDFTRRALLALERANGGRMSELVLLWSSRLTRTPYLERLKAQHVGVQVWGSSTWPESRAVLDAGFRAVLSNVEAWYLDCGFGSWRDSSDGHCGPYRSWQQMYEHRPWKEKGAAWRVEGGEACQWTEQLAPGGLDARVWPRAAALAERLWADRAEGAGADVYLRLDTQRARLVARGVRAAPLWPRWCSHNPHACL